ncbi:hypothetical protein Bbelb_386610 [Branchiostoma belcheri]|nr:hypothetical protein Bbelb_386610 [Branchiostoma belcheri]
MNHCQFLWHVWRDAIGRDVSGWSLDQLAESTTITAGYDPALGFEQQCNARRKEDRVEGKRLVVASPGRQYITRKCLRHVFRGLFPKWVKVRTSGFVPRVDQSAVSAPNFAVS